MLAESFDPRLPGSGKQLAISRLLNLLADDTKMDEPSEKHQESPMTGAFAEPTPGSSKRRSNRVSLSVCAIRVRRTAAWM